MHNSNTEHDSIDASHVPHRLYASVRECVYFERFGYFKSNEKSFVGIHMSHYSCLMDKFSISIYVRNGYMYMMKSIYRVCPRAFLYGIIIVCVYKSAPIQSYFVCVLYTVSLDARWIAGALSVCSCCSVCKGKMQKSWCLLLNVLPLSYRSVTYSL